MDRLGDLAVYAAAPAVGAGFLALSVWLVRALSFIRRGVEQANVVAESTHNAVNGIGVNEPTIHVKLDALKADFVDLKAQVETLGDKVEVLSDLPRKVSALRLEMGNNTAVGLTTRIKQEEMATRVNELAERIERIPPP